jgi:hypothetical protein
MEHQLLKAIVAILATLPQGKKTTAFDYSDALIVKVYYWSVIWDRPVAWACRKENWPPHLRRQRLPSESTLSRRLRSPAVVALLDALERRVTAPQEPGLFWLIDGKPLPIGGCSKDRQAGYGRSAGGMAKGYKLHTLTGSDGKIAVWRVAPMNKDERVMAARLLKAAPPEVVGYVTGDSNYDSNKLHEICDNRGELQLMTPRRYGPGKGTGHRKQAAGRLRMLERTENPFPAFAQRLFRDRSEIERRFGHLTNWGGGLSSLPAWVRTHRRVRRWAQAKLVLTELKRQMIPRTCAA